VEQAGDLPSPVARDRFGAGCPLPDGPHADPEGAGHRAAPARAVEGLPHLAQHRRVIECRPEGGRYLVSSHRDIVPPPGCGSYRAFTRAPARPRVAIAPTGRGDGM